MRIALARLLLGPAGQSASSGEASGLLLLDEPTNHLDRCVGMVAASLACRAELAHDILYDASQSMFSAHIFCNALTAGKLHFFKCF